jgi:hypothetical protein
MRGSRGRQSRVVWSAISAARAAGSAMAQQRQERRALRALAGPFKQWGDGLHGRLQQPPAAGIPATWRQLSSPTCPQRLLLEHSRHLWRQRQGGAEGAVAARKPWEVCSSRLCVWGGWVGNCVGQLGGWVGGWVGGCVGKKEGDAASSSNCSHDKPRLLACMQAGRQGWAPLTPGRRARTHLELALQAGEGGQVVAPRAAPLPVFGHVLQGGLVHKHSLRGSTGGSTGGSVGAVWGQCEGRTVAVRHREGQYKTPLMLCKGARSTSTAGTAARHAPAPGAPPQTGRCSSR